MDRRGLGLAVHPPIEQLTDQPIKLLKSRVTVGIPRAVAAGVAGSVLPAGSYRHNTVATSGGPITVGRSADYKSI
jgi:hypothetical protein